ncbi:MAG: ABC transporter substrate-binding protein [Chloroflexi bacterium]|nr:ABC transporter substrate-binding protein [Chloroflexota bacterium]
MDIDVVEMGFPDMLTAFANKAIDAAVLTEPFSTIAPARGLAVDWKRVHPYFYPDYKNSALVYSPQFIQSQSEAAKRFLIAYLRGVRAYMDASDKQIGWNEVVQILAKYTAVKDPAMYDNMRVAGFNRNGYVSVESLTNDQEFYVAEGVIKPDEKADIGKMVDHSYLENALNILGKQ